MLTDSQIYTLRRLCSGTIYLLRGDGKKGDEYIRPPLGKGIMSSTIKNAPSLPVLYRQGLVDFVLSGEKHPSLWYKVRITSKGRDTCSLSKTKGELKNEQTPD